MAACFFLVLSRAAYVSLIYKILLHHVKTDDNRLFFWLYSRVPLSVSGRSMGLVLSSMVSVRVFVRKSAVVFIARDVACSKKKQACAEKWRELLSACRAGGVNFP